MQKAIDFYDSSSCHSFCSTNARHFREIDEEELDFEADRLETVFLSKEPSLPKGELEESKAPAESSAEVEEGEIKDSSSVESCDDSHRCRFFEKGRCVYGEKCRFLHQSDKGLYNMFERPRLAPYRRLRRPLKIEPILPASSPDEDLADWDKELEKAMLRVGYSRKKVPFDKLSLTIRTTQALPAYSIPVDKTSVQRVRCHEQEERKPSGLVASRRNYVRKNEMTHSLSLKFSRNNKRRHLDTSRSRSRSLSIGRRFSCKCCRTPSPKPGRRRTSRRPICRYRRRSVSASSSSPSPVSRKRPRTVAYNPRWKRGGLSRANSPERTKTRPCTGNAKASIVREFQTLKTHRNSIALASRSPPRTAKTKVSGDKNISAKVDKLIASYSPDRRLSDMSISPTSSDSDSENEPDFFSIRRPSDMSISPFSDTSSPKSSFPGGRVDKLTSGAEVPNLPPVPRKVLKSDDSVPKKRVKSNIAERNSLVGRHRDPISKSSAPEKRLRGEVEEPKPSAISREIPKYVSSYLKNRLESNATKPQLSAIQLEEPKFECSIPTKKSKNDAAEPKLSVVSLEIPKYPGSPPKKKFTGDTAEPRPPAVSQEIQKSVDAIPKKKLKSDTTEPKPPAISRQMSKSKNSIPKKRFNHLLFDLMKFHKKDGSTKVAVKQKETFTVKLEETPKTKINQKSVTHPGVFLSKKELLLKQLQEVNAAIERKKALAKQNL